MRKTIIYALTITMCIFLSCSNNDLEDEKPNGPAISILEPTVTPNNLEAFTAIDRDQLEESEQLILGYGVDVTGDFASKSSVKEPILDIDKIAADKYALVYTSGATAGYGRHICGTTAKEYIDELNRVFRFRIGEEDSIQFFTGTLLDNELLNDPTNGEYSYASAHDVFEGRHARFYMSQDINYKYLTDNFKTDIKTLSASQIIDKYGTHVINEYTMGSRLDFLYRSKIFDYIYVIDQDTVTINEDRYAVVRSGLREIEEKTATWFWMIESKPKEDLSDRNYNPIIQTKSIGGANICTGVYNLEKEYPVLDQSEWRKTIEDNYALILIKGVDRIYEYVEDEVKKKELKDAVDKYILERQIK